MFALEEAGLDYELQVVDNGWFLRRYFTNGPLLKHGDIEVIEMDAITRYIGRVGGLWPEDSGQAAQADRFLEAQSVWIRPNLVRGHTLRNVSIPASQQAYDVARRGLRSLEHHLGHSDWASSSFCAADCATIVLRIAPRLGLPLDEFDNVMAYLRRLEDRPALARARARIEREGGG